MKNSILYIIFLYIGMCSSNILAKESQNKNSEKHKTEKVLPAMTPKTGPKASPEYKKAKKEKKEKANK